MILYHYTDQNGFMGIFQQRELWATKIQFLNDSNEHKLALDLAAKLLESYAKITRPKCKGTAKSLQRQYSSH